MKQSSREQYLLSLRPVSAQPSTFCLEKFLSTSLHNVILKTNVLEHVPHFLVFKLKNRVDIFTNRAWE